MGDAKGGGGGGGVTMGGGAAGETLATALGNKITTMTSAKAVKGNVIIRGSGGTRISLTPNNQQALQTQMRNTKGSIVATQGKTSIKIDQGNNKRMQSIREATSKAATNRTGRGGQTIK